MAGTQRTRAPETFELNSFQSHCHSVQLCLAQTKGILGFNFYYCHMVNGKIPFFASDSHNLIRMNLKTTKKRGEKVDSCTISRASLCLELNRHINSHIYVDIFPRSSEQQNGMQNSEPPTRVSASCELSGVTVFCVRRSDASMKFILLIWIWMSGEFRERIRTCYLWFAVAEIGPH